MTTQAFYNHVADQAYETLRPLWNEYIAETGDGGQIFDGVEELASIFEFEGAQLARMVFFGNLKDWWGDVYLNGYGNIESCWGVDSSPIRVQELAEWLEDSNHGFYQEWLEDRNHEFYQEWLEDSNHGFYQEWESEQEESEE